MATVIITGISRGIGLGLAARYLKRGDTVAGTVRAANAAVALRSSSERSPTATPGIRSSAGTASGDAPD